MDSISLKKTIHHLTHCLIAGSLFVPLSSYADFFISSFGTNQLMRFDENSGLFLGIIANIDGPYASQIGFDGDLFVSSHNTGEVLRFNSTTGEFKGAFIKAHEGGLINPTAPNFGPDGKVYVGDSATNKVLRYDENGKFIDVFADGATSGLDGPFMQTFDETTMFIASGNTNSILRYDLKTKEFMGAFVPPGSGGLTLPVGLEFGPDGNLYASSSATNEVLRYNGKTGEFIDKFVPSGVGGLLNPKAVRFGGPNSDLYVISSDTNTVVQFDRTSGAFIRVVTNNQNNGMEHARGLTFTPRPKFNVWAEVIEHKECEDGEKEKGKNISRRSFFKSVHVSHILQDYLDRSPLVRLVSIVSTDPNIDMKKSVRDVRYGMEDYHFDIDFRNESGTDQKYIITYTATDIGGAITFATTEILVPPTH